MMADTIADKIGVGDRYKKKKPFSFTEAFNNLYDRLTKDDKEKGNGQKTSMLKRNKKKGTA